MYSVDRPTRHSKEFVDCLAADVRQLDGLLREVGVNIQELPPPDEDRMPEALARKNGIRYAWIKCAPARPLPGPSGLHAGNQAFSARMEDADGSFEFPDTCEGLARVAEGLQGYFCIMPMRRVRKETSVKAKGSSAPPVPHARPSAPRKPPIIYRI